MNLFYIILESVSFIQQIIIEGPLNAWRNVRMVLEIQRSETDMIYAAWCLPLHSYKQHSKLQQL